ncbi:MAG: hypothetical protein WC261_05590 [Synergistaceae bacterium]|jgi:hypothetical protein
MSKVKETYKKLLDNGDKRIIVRVDLEEFELSDGSIFPIDPPLEKELSIEEFERIYRKTLKAVGSCEPAGSYNTDPA